MIRMAHRSQQRRPDFRNHHSGACRGIGFPLVNIDARYP
jgi:hypothetical protein